MKKTLLFGPILPPINGQSIAFTTLVQNVEKENKIVINTAYYKSKQINTIVSVLKTVYVFTFYKFETIYFTCSRSNFGFIKEFPMLFLARVFKKRVVNHLHGAVFKKFYAESDFLRPFIKYAYSKVDTSIVLLESMKNEFSDFKNMKTKTIPNFYMQNLEIEVDFSKKKKQVVYLSNLMVTKGVFEFLDAIENLLETKKMDIIFKIAGAPLGDGLINAKKVGEKFNYTYNNLKRRFPRNIFYLGVVKGDQKVSLLAESSIFVLPTYYSIEAFPLSIIEAMRTGNAVISTKHNFIPEIIEDNVNGKIIEPKSSQKIVESIEYLFSNEIRLQEIQKNNILESKKKYKQDQYVKSLKEVIFCG